MLRVPQNKSFFLAILNLFIGIYSVAQTTQVQFGQNRVQYHKFDWQYTETNNYDLYFYKESKAVADYVATIAEYEIQRMTDILDYSYRQRFDILVFNNLQDYTQTNIGLNNDIYNIGGTFKINENKIFLYFDGNHQHIQQQFRKALAEIFITQMMKGGSFGQRIQNLILLNTPEWYTKGITTYLASGWNSTSDDKLRSFYLEQEVKFNKLAKRNPEFAGASFWYMIAQEYGEDAIATILYLTRIHHSINSAFKIGIGKSTNSLLDDWKSFYATRYAEDAKGRSIIDGASTISSNKGNVINLCSNPNGNYIAYTVLKNGIARTYLQQQSKQSKQKINRVGSKQVQADNYNSVVALSKNNQFLAVIYNKGNRLIIAIRDLAKKKTTKYTVQGIDKVYSADFLGSSPNTILLTAQRNGQSDMFLYNVGTTSVQQITNTLFDEIDAKSINYGGEEKILYSSNQPIAEVSDISSFQFPAFDLFLSEIDGTNSIRLTETTHADEFPMGMFDDEHYSFISDDNGIYNAYSGYLSKVFIKNDTIKNDDGTLTIEERFKTKGINTPTSNYNQNILIATNNNSSNLFLFRDNKSYKRQKSNYVVLYQNKATIADNISLKATQYVISNFGETPKKSTKQINVSTKEIQPMLSKEISWDSLYQQDFLYIFQSKFNNTIGLPSSSQDSNNLNDDILVIDITTEKPSEDLPKRYTLSSDIIGKSTIKKYYSRFATDYLTTQVDNSILQTYQSFQQNLGSYSFPKIGALVNVGISDVLDNHKLSGVGRIPFSFDGYELALNYKALKHRIDNEVSFYTRNNKFGFTYNFIDSLGNILYTGQTVAKTITYTVNNTVSYPLNNTNAVRLQLGYRYDKFAPTFVDEASLFLEATRENWLSGKVEFVHDDAQEIQYNIPIGMKFKVYAEYYKNINLNKSNIYNIGFDFRYYFKFVRNLIWANRVAYASSFGSQKILYFLGGVDTWLNQQYDTDIPISNSINYGLQAPVNNMRGLPQNIRNGNNYLVWNTELRFPLFSFFAKRPLQSDFIKDFQLIGFYDAGIAYDKPNPFDKENAVREEVINSTLNPVVVSVKYYRNPFVFGFGGGLRTNLMGYFVRIDTGWGFDGLKLKNKPIWHISLSKDF